MKKSGIQFPRVQFDNVVLAGGWDQTTPGLMLKSGVARTALNFECGVTGGYQRIAGYERMDGMPSPSDADGQFVDFWLYDAGNISVSDTLAGVTSGNTATVNHVSGYYVGVTGISGAFNLMERVNVSGSLVGITDAINGVFLAVAAYDDDPPAVGATVTGESSGETATVVYVSGLNLGISSATGTFTVGENLLVGATLIGEVTVNDGTYFTFLDQSTAMPSVGQTIVGATSSATGVIAYVVGTSLGITKVTGFFVNDETLTVSASLVGVAGDVEASAPTAKDLAQFMAGAAAQYRADIGEVPGSGPTRGGFKFGGVFYAFRDDMNGNKCRMYKSSASGWVEVDLLQKVEFTSGSGAPPTDGDTLSQGAVTATVRRASVRGGVDTSTLVWAGDAYGALIIEGVSGGNFASGAATIGSTTITVVGTEQSVEFSAGGRFESIEHNFFASSEYNRVYGCNGLDVFFEFDGDVVIPVPTEQGNDSPSCLIAHTGYLMVVIGPTVVYSAPGLPTHFDAIDGAGTFGLGEDITNLVPISGGTTASALGILTRTKTSILYGTGPQDWNLVHYNVGVGAVAHTTKNMTQTLAFDDRGVFSVQAALQYGNFKQTTLTAGIIPFIDSVQGLATAASLSRGKSQYRIFFSSGDGLYVTIVNGKTLGVMPVYFPDHVNWTWEGRDANGDDVSYFGSDNGYIFQLDKGTSFDGVAIPFTFAINYTHAKSPQVLKRWKKAAIEVDPINNVYVEFDVRARLGYDAAKYLQSASETISLIQRNTPWDSAISEATVIWDQAGYSPMEVWLEGTAENISLLVTGEADYLEPFNVSTIMIHFIPRREI